MKPLDAGVGYVRLAEEIKRLVAEHGVGVVVVGLPRNMDGSEGAGARMARRLAEHIRAYVGGVKVILHDERLTTVMAERALLEADLTRAHRRRLIDGQAAVILLTDYLKSAPTRGQPAAPEGAEIGVSVVPSEDREDIVILTDDEGNEVEFLFLDAFTVQDRRYAVLVPLEGTDDEDEEGEEDAIEGSEAMIFRLEEDGNGDEVFVEIEDDDEWAEVTAAWEDLQDEDLEEEEEDEDSEADEEVLGDDDDEDEEDDRPRGGGR